MSWSHKALGRKTAFGLAVLLLALAGCSAGPDPAPSPPSSMDELKAELEQFSTERLAAGASAVLIQAGLGGEVWSNAEGVRDLETKVPAESGDSFHMASLTKSMVATSVLKLVEQGKIRLDDLVSDDLPEFDSVLHPPKPITVRMLLDHTSGMPGFEELLIRSGPVKEVLATPLTAERRLELTGMAPWDSADVGVYEYSNSNYVVLGLLVERVSGRSLGDVLRTDIVEPLGLAGTLLAGTAKAPATMVHGYVMIDGERVDATEAGVQSRSASGGMISTVQDVNVFFSALLAGKVVNPALVKEMQSQNSSEYGLGLAKWWDSCTSGYYYGHLGGAPGYASIAMTSADGSRQLAVFMAHAAEPLSVDTPPGDYGLEEFAQKALDSTCD
ncbi:serine hydrolase domain-containing protein [Arthrobacter sp. CDRTa11]|uniref:serine hydrolase domain-containing protein n=1 Tax=Arthrobacter sp. CDRTa11 TaxID=2651199 RepID=UPI0022658902|nr:serine hydrolase domain-containing protein [Arthrobacter sp. CDRTa11]